MSDVIEQLRGGLCGCRIRLGSAVALILAKYHTDLEDKMERKRPRLDQTSI